MRKNIFLMLVIILAAIVKAGAQDEAFDPIIRALKESDAKSLSASFNITIELSLPDNENTYSASQGEMIMKDFFKKYPPDAVIIKQEGTTDPVSRFSICDYSSGSLQFQVYIYLRKEKERYLIYKIKFEEKK